MDDMHNDVNWQAVLDRVCPGSTPVAVTTPDGSYSNLTQRVDARDNNGMLFLVIVRRYVYGQRARKARIEYAALQYLSGSGLPAPEPLLLDDTGDVLGRPGIVMGFVPGALMLEPAQHPGGPLAYAEELGRVLARIHTIPAPADRDILFDGNAEAVWFLREGIPDFMRQHPLGEQVWHTVHELRPKITPVTPCLVHLDYWRGNVLWEGDHISAVVDWEEASYGDPGVDVAYCMMELANMGRLDAMHAFLHAYTGMHGPVANLTYWQLAASARPMYDFEGWCTTHAQQENLNRFILGALKASG